MGVTKVGILGCGVGAALQVRGLRFTRDTEIIWFCDKNEERARAISERSGADALISTDFEDVLSKHTPDVVHIVTPPATHASLAIHAMEHGCNVLIEKPLALTVNDAQRILDVRDRTGTRLCMMHNHMFDPTVIKAHEIVKKGILGDLICVEGRHFYECRKMEEEGLHDPDHWVHTLKSGTAGEFMPHTVYLLHSFAGSCQHLQLIHTTHDQLEDEKHAVHSWSVQMKCKEAVGRIFVTDDMPYGHFGLDLYGTKAAFHLNMMDLTYSIERIHRYLPLTAARMASTVEQSIQKSWQILSNSVGIVTGRLKRRPGHIGLVRAFYDALRSGGSMPVSGEDGLEVVRIMEMLDTAVEEHGRGIQP